MSMRESFMFKMMLECIRDPNIKMVVVDPKGDEYKNLTEILGGKIVNVDVTKNGYINPFTGESSYTDKLKKRADKLIKEKKI